MLDELANRIKALVGRCIITAVKKDGGEWLADGEFLDGEKRRDVEFLQQYGFTSRPKGDVSGVALFIGGSRENGVVVGSRGESDDMAAELEEGEVMVHSPYGQRILLKKDGSVDISIESGKAMHLNGDLEVDGDVKVGKEVSAGTAAGPGVKLTTHVHPSAVGPTSPPTVGS